MSVLSKIAERARANNAHIVLSEGEDPRIIKGGLRAVDEGIARVTFLADPMTFADKTGGKDLPEGVAIIDPVKAEDHETFAQTYLELRGHKGVTIESSAAAVRDPLGYAAMMVRHGKADGTIGGAVATTGDTLRAALQIIGKDPAVKTVSSFFLMVLNEEGGEKPVAFADCAMVVMPTAEELASIATSTARSFTNMVGEEPRVAMLSFSTYGSAAHEQVSRVQEATKIAKAAAPDLLLDGELQFDAAFVQEVAASKAKDSPVAGNANVFVFPSLDAGNIGYKIAQRIGGAAAVGPVLQGLAKPANDLSRGCSADDVFHTIAATAAMVDRT